MNMVNTKFINSFKKPFWLINTARGKSVVTEDLVKALKSGKVLGAGLDVLEYEKYSFENFFRATLKDESHLERSREVSKDLDCARPDNEQNSLPDALQYLMNAENVILTPHVAGWTIESKQKLAQTIVDKIKAKFC